MSLRLKAETIEELTKLLQLDDLRLRKHSAGKLIRDSFRLRGWLKNGKRGKPFKGNERSNDL